MPLTLFDSHAHYDDSAFDCDREALLDLLPSKGVCGIVNAASDLSSTRRGIALAERYPYVWAAAGIHPQEAGHWCDEEGNPSPEAVQELRALCSHPRVVAVGEIGLDYYYDTPGRECQRRWLRCQLALAAELHLPVILHDREAHEDTLKLLRQHPVEGVVHCFSGSVEMARELVRLGYYIGLGGCRHLQKCPPRSAGGCGCARRPAAAGNRRPLHDAGSFPRKAQPIGLHRLYRPAYRGAAGYHRRGAVPPNSGKYPPSLPHPGIGGP